MSEMMVIEVFGGTCESSCDTCGGRCSTGGSGTDLEEEASQLASELKSQYGDKIEFRYIDTDQVGINRYPMVSRAIQAGYNFPVVAVNGKPRLAGGLDFTSVNGILQEEFRNQK